MTDRETISEEHPLTVENILRTLFPTQSDDPILNSMQTTSLVTALSGMRKPQYESMIQDEDTRRLIGVTFELGTRAGVAEVENIFRKGLNLDARDPPGVQEIGVREEGVWRMGTQVGRKMYRYFLPEPIARQSDRGKYTLAMEVLRPDKWIPRITLSGENSKGEKTKLFEAQRGASVHRGNVTVGLTLVTPQGEYWMRLPTILADNREQKLPFTRLGDTHW
ncbi:hypothetical protein TREMEDRAFT_60313 [Tremella mesenterica DSM 1558]|uniref:uncharacterized protein n=1 Tax=Tremella mesenterica (strain ATCC 24925 / CBS 8224 / DSM 1558 / NBRC 9311 / NRRL Y-6157 / RJB 2259-6 / UBC 559-6) TaxID=578456 RepID=UPI0003F49A3A|nr:uncharacterized protein TREMEDRAFT_60313 [Tremella mesenterica DSM 1558]EIW71383.1 hypothetical protein TREMEDRAFT_60313 [Tremella mesenterica DSM 1558]